MSNSQSPAVEGKRTLRSGTRNPRRRPRQSDADSVKSAPRRKRSKINEDTFHPPRHSEEVVNGSIEVASTNGDVHHHHHQTETRRSRGHQSRKEDARMLLDTSEMPVRSKKAALKRPTRSDGATVLTQNARYSIRLLPSTPRDLRREGVEYRGSLGAGHHALAITRDRAYVWDYTAHALVTTPRTFNLPFPVKPSEVLPFGALISAGSTTDPGLVLVSATTGKIFFYESIERAASLGLFQDRNSAIEGATPSLWIGETVTDLVLADHAGVILTLSSGRIMYFTLRDAQGKVRIAAEALRVEQESAGGFFGSIKDYLGTGAFRKDVSALHTRTLDNRGRLQILALTERAELQIWDLEWNGRPTSGNAIDFKELLVGELKKEETAETQGRSEAISTLDFAIVNSPDLMTDVATPALDKPIVLLVLARVGPLGNSAYVLAEMSIEGHEPICTRLMEVSSFHPSTPKLLKKPRLLLPAPQHTAIIFHEDAMTFVSLEIEDVDGPDAQLRGVTAEPTNFEDTTYLHRNRPLEILGADIEGHKSSNETSIAFVQSCGLVRVSATEPSARNKTSHIPARTLIEQAVFHGALQEENILDFSRRGDSKYTPKEIENAALAVSDEVLQSTSSFISATPTSMESHLAFKAEALRALVTFVRQNYPAVSSKALWQLLWDAERVASAQRIWQAFEKHVAAVSQVKRTATAMDEICATLLRGLNQSQDEEMLNESEAARDFLIHHLDKLEMIFPMAKDLVVRMKADQDVESGKKMRIVEESCQLWAEGLEAVFQFRIENASAYGIVPDFIQDGILTDVAEYGELPEFWTSTENLLKSVVKMTNISRDCVAELFEDENDEDVAADFESVIQKFGAEIARLIQLTCLIYRERINWLASRPEQKQQEISRKLQENYEKTRYEQIRALANIAQSEAGLKIAEKYRDMDLLTVMIVAEMQFALEELPTASDERRSAILRYLESMRLRIGKYFERFGDDWANAYFDAGFSNQAGLMLKDGHEAWQDALTRYLRAEPSRAKISWINDLIADKDFARASRSLTFAGQELETRLWNRKVELSLAKLAILATQEGLEEGGKPMSKDDLNTLIPEDDLVIVGIQQQLYDHLFSELIGLIDHQAELQEATRRFAWKNQDLQALRQVLHSGLDRILSHEALSASELIDVLTLMDVTATSTPETNLDSAEFFLALKILSAAAPSLGESRTETLLQLIWKRAYVYDDWIAINSAPSTSDETTSANLRDTVLWKTLYHAFTRNLFPTPDSPVSSTHPSVRFLLPSDCLGAGCRPEDLAWRFSSSSHTGLQGTNGHAHGDENADDGGDGTMDLLAPIVQDNKVHDEQLAGFVDDRRLDSWSDMVLKDVMRVVVDEEGEMRELREREKGFALRFLAREREVDENANGEVVNGHINGFAEDEDVEMS